MSLDNPFRDKPVARHDLPEVVGRLYRERGRRILGRIADLESIQHHSSSLEGDILSSEEEKKEWETRRFEESCFERPLSTLHLLADSEEPDDMQEDEASDDIDKEGHRILALCRLIQARRDLHLPVYELVQQLPSPAEIFKTAYSSTEVYCAYREVSDEGSIHCLDQLLERATADASQFWKNIQRKQFRLSQQRDNIEMRKEIEDELEKSLCQETENLEVFTIDFVHIHDLYFNYLDSVRDQPDRIQHVLDFLVMKKDQCLSAGNKNPKLLSTIGCLCAKFGRLDEAENIWDLLRHGTKEAEQNQQVKLLLTLSRTSVTVNPEDARMYFLKALKILSNESDSCFEKEFIECIEIALLFQHPLEALRSIERYKGYVHFPQTPVAYLKLIEAYTLLGATEEASRCRETMKQELGLAFDQKEFDQNISWLIPWHIVYAHAQILSGTDPRPFLQAFCDRVLDLMNNRLFSNYKRHFLTEFKPFIALAGALAEYDLDPTPLLDALKIFITVSMKDRVDWRWMIPQHLQMIMEQETKWAVKQITTSRASSLS